MSVGGGNRASSQISGHATVQGWGKSKGNWEPCLRHQYARGLVGKAAEPQPTCVCGRLLLPDEDKRGSGFTAGVGPLFASALLLSMLGRRLERCFFELLIWLLVFRICMANHL